MKKYSTPQDLLEDAAYLQEVSPVHWDDRLGSFCLTRYDDVREALLDESRFLSHPPDALPAAGEFFSMNGPMHRMYRALVTPTFSVNALRAGFEPHLEHEVATLIDQMLPAREAELISQFAKPLPSWTMSRLLGALELNEGEFIRDHQISVESQADPSNEPLAAMAPDARERVSQVLMAVARRAQAGELDGLMGELPGVEVDGEALSLDELVAISRILLAGGLFTTQNFIGNLVYLLGTHADQFDWLLEHLEERLDPALEEVLRFLPPTQIRIRFAAEDIELRGVTIPRGSRVIPMLWGANRDPRAFDDPHRFDVTRFDPARRRGKRAARVLSFGWGPHHCLGEFLARLEVRYATRSLLTALPGLRLVDDPDSVVFQGFRHRGPRDLRIAWG